MHRSDLQDPWQRDWQSQEDRDELNPFEAAFGQTALRQVVEQSGSTSRVSSSAVEEARTTVSYSANRDGSTRVLGWEHTRKQTQTVWETTVHSRVLTPAYREHVVLSESRGEYDAWHAHHASRYPPPLTASSYTYDYTPGSSAHYVPASVSSQHYSTLSGSGQQTTQPAADHFHTAPRHQYPTPLPVQKQQLGRPDTIIPEPRMRFPGAHQPQTLYFVPRLSLPQEPPVLAPVVRGPGQYIFTPYHGPAALVDKHLPPPGILRRASGRVGVGRAWAWPVPADPIKGIKRQVGPLSRQHSTPKELAADEDANKIVTLKNNRIAAGKSRLKKKEQLSQSVAGTRYFTLFWPLFHWPC